MLFALLAFCASPAFHPESLSSSRIEVDGNEARLTMRCQALSLEEILPWLDANGDGEVDAAEVDAQQALITDYISQNYTLTVGSNRDLQGGVRLIPEPILAQRVAGPEEATPGYRKGAVDVTMVYRSDGPIQDLLIEHTLFQETSPGHVDIASVEFTTDGESLSRTFVLDENAPFARWDPTGRGAFSAFVKLGWQHILSGWDHLAFLVALVLASRRLRSLLAVVTAFTLAHSVTLALASTGTIQVARFAPFIETLIALSIAYVALDSVFQPRRQLARWPEAFGFGLIHGLGFAGFLAQSLVQEQSQTLALVAFNAGVELGQVAIVVALALVLRFLPKGQQDPEDCYLAPTWLRYTGSLAVAALGLYWFWQRI